MKKRLFWWRQRPGVVEASLPCGHRAKIDLERLDRMVELHPVLREARARGVADEVLFALHDLIHDEIDAAIDAKEEDRERIDEATQAGSDR